MKISTQKITMASLFAALVCIATMLIQIPSPLKGYLNLGDCVVLAAGWMLSPVYGFLAAGIGSALADIFSGYVMYAPATFLIKGLMSVTAYYGFYTMYRKIGEFSARLLGGIAAEILMIMGYFWFESVLYGMGASALNIPANAVQGTAGLALGLVLVKALKKNRIYH